VEFLIFSSYILRFATKAFHHHMQSDLIEHLWAFKGDAA
jgi:hypothetical protein